MLRRPVERISPKVIFWGRAVMERAYATINVSTTRVERPWAVL